jgi:hypothetical protein
MIDAVTTDGNLADHHPHRHLAPGAPDAGNRLVPGEPHGGEIDPGDRHAPGDQQRR